eukprot:925383_1
MASYTTVLSIYNHNNSASESIIFSANVLKFEKRDKTKQRILVVTDKAIYDIKPKNNFIQRRINLLDIASITISSVSTECTINIPSEYDYQFDSMNTSLQHEIISMISQQMIKLQHTIFINKIKNKSTTPWTITQTKLKNVNSHYNEAVRTVMALDCLMNMGFTHAIAHKAFKNKRNVPLATQFLIKEFVKNAKNGDQKIYKSPLISVTEVNTTCTVTYSVGSYNMNSPPPSNTKKK